MATIYGTNNDFKVPSLDLRFADRKNLVDTISGRNLITFSRNSIGTYVDENGVIQSAASGAARFDHDPVTGESLGLLVEESRTNLLTYSSTNSNWTAVNGTYTPNAAVAPDGTITASLFVPNNGSTGYFRPSAAATITASTTYTISFWAKPTNPSSLNRLLLTGDVISSRIQISVDFLLTGDGSVNQENVGTGVIEAYPNGWYRCSATGVSKSTATSTIPSAYSLYQTGDGTSGFYIWGAQLEAGSFPTSYIPTPATFTSRASTATYYDASGVIQTAAIDEARDDAYFPDENGVMQPAGLLLEGSATNLVTYSESMNTSFTTGTQASWTTSAPSITAPDGSSTTTALNCQVGAVTRSYRAFSTTFNAVPHTFSVWLKFNIPTFNNNITLRYADVADAHVQAVSFNLSGNGSAGSGGKITPFSNGWYKCEFYFTPIAGSEHVGLWFGFNAANTGASVYAWGAQLEESPYATSYIPTTSSTVTRAADVSSSSTVTRAADVATLTNNNIYNTDTFTITNEPFGASGGSSTLSLVGPNIKRTSVYSSNLSQATINKVVRKTDEFWRWRILGNDFGINYATNGQVTVDWGDGTVETISGTSSATHTFTNGSGYHEIGFRLDSGTYFRPRVYTTTHTSKLIAIGPAPETMKYIDGDSLFRSCSNLESFDATAVFGGNGGTTSFSSTWRECSKLKNFPFIDSSNITNFESAWFSCTSLTSFPLIDTSSGTNFTYSWYNCTSLTSFPLIDTSSGTNFQQTWQNCSSLTSFPLIDTSSGTNFRESWRVCSSLTSFPALSMSSGTNFYRTWEGCNSLTSFPLIDMSSGTNFQEAWKNCINLTDFSAVDTSSGTNFQETWRSCSSLTSFPLIDTSSGTNFRRAWYSCASLTSFPLIDTSSGTNFSDTWFNCNSLTSFPLIDTSSGTTFNSAWYNCTSLTSFPAIDTSSGTDFFRAWRNCSSLTSFPAINTSSSTTFYQAWYSCTNLTSFPANFFDSWTGTPGSNCFVGTWENCYDLTAASVENILNSIDTSGQSAPASGVDITIDYDAGTGTPSVSTAVTNLKSRGWTITLNGVAQ